MSDCSPIALFTYNRPEHTAATLRALADNELASESELTVFCDGPASPEQVENTQRVREIVHAAQGFKRVHVVEHDENLGIARSVIAGVNEVLEKHETIIVLEDDLVTLPYFLSYMNDGLRLYADDDRVMSLCGYTFPVGAPLPETFFAPGAFCWGWATWRRGWALYEYDARKALAEIVRRDLIYEFDFLGSDPLTLILQATAIEDRRADSWATRWMASACLNGKLTLYPGRSLVANTGFDGSGRHANVVTRYETPLADRRPRVGTAPVEVLPEVVAAHRALFIRWRVGRSKKKWLYYRLTRLLPHRIEKRLYTYQTVRSLQASERLGRSIMKQ